MLPRWLTSLGVVMVWRKESTGAAQEQQSQTVANATQRGGQGLNPPKIRLPQTALWTEGPVV